MAQARTPAGTAVGSGAGEQTGGDSTTLNAPEAIAWTQAVDRTNRMDNVDQFSAAVSAAGEAVVFVTQGAGRIVGITAHNDAVAADGTNGFRISVNNEDQADELQADWGFGSAANAAAAADQTSSVAANAIVHMPNSLSANETLTTKYFSYGDLLTVDVLEDGASAIAMDITVYLEYSSVGHV